MRVGSRHLQVGEVERALGAVQEDQPPRAEAADLAGELGTDGAGAAGYEDRFSGDLALHLLEVEVHGFPTQQILDFDVPEFADAEAARQQVLQRGKDLELDAGGSAAG